MFRTLPFAVIVVLAFSDPTAITTGHPNEAILFDEVLPQDELNDFLGELAYHESRNRYTVVNRYGYMGKYQFGMTTLKGLGYNVSRNEFLNSPFLQEEAMLKLLDHNRDILTNYINRYDGKYVHGIKITESGILAAAHLVGPSRVKNFLYTGKVYTDGNNTPVTRYLTTFQGYQLDTLSFESRLPLLLASLD